MASLSQRAASRVIREFGGLILPALLKKSVLGLVALVALSGAAKAEERLMMPFACKIEHGNVVLVPSRAQSYRIYGAREHRRFTTCSPARPDRCRSWTVHRFDLDCGGVRIDWPSVVGAMAPWTRGADRTYTGRAPQSMGPRRYARPGHSAQIGKAAHRRAPALWTASAVRCSSGRPKADGLSACRVRAGPLAASTFRKDPWTHQTGSHRPEECSRGGSCQSRQ